MLGQMNESRDRQHQMLSKMDDNIERMSQHTVRIIQMLAEPTLSFDRLMETADRRVQRMERAP